MSRPPSPLVCRMGGGAASVALLFVGAAAARAQSVTPVETGPVGRIDFTAANLPPATVEVDIAQGMLGDLFGLGDAAIAGITESLAKSPAAQNNADTAALAAEKLATAREVIQLAKDVVTEIRVRVYDNSSEASVETVANGSLFDAQLTNENWDRAVRVKDENDSVQVSFLRREGAIRGVFVVVADGKDFVLANVVCDVSPENVKKLSAAATTIGLDNGLLQRLDEKLKHFH